MQIINKTRMPADVTVHTEIDGRETLVVVVKGTFRIPEDATTIRLHDEQQPLVMSDVFYGEPGKSAPKYEVDFAPRKHRCDVLLNAAAHAPDGRPATRVTVGVRIGSWSKSFDVVGDRRWVSGVPGLSQSPAAPFTSMPITYDHAFGGTDDKHPDPSHHSAFMGNPVGRGFHKQTDLTYIDGTPLPNTEETGNPVSGFDGNYRPMSYGPLGRHWHPRAAYAGTYDQQWLDAVFPFLPADFDDRYFQAAPVDQQLSKPLGEQSVTLLNLTPDGRREFVIPAFDAPIIVFPKRGGREDLTGELDTVVIEPESDRIMLTWRVTRQLKRSVFEIAQIHVGRQSRVWTGHGEGSALLTPAAPNR